MFVVHISINDIYFKVMFQPDSFEGPKVKFDHVLVHKAMMLRYGHRTIACGMPDQSICKKFEWVLFQNLYIPFNLLFIVIWNRNTCQE